jgi:hypothetical protein
MADYIDIPINNLYSTGVLLSDADTQETVLSRIPLSIVPAWEDRWHIVKSDDTFDSVAYEYYSTDTNAPEHLWWALAEANGIINPFDITNMVGAYMLIPNYQRLKSLISQAQDGDYIAETEQSVANNYFVLNNPPVALNPPDVPTDQEDGNTDTGAAIMPHLFLKKRNVGGYILVHADEDGAITGTPANPADYDNPVIYDVKP